MEEKFEGCILGLAVGDALGMPAEGMRREDVKKIFKKIVNFLPSPYGDLKAGEWTDDTEQMIILAESILETVYFDPENFAEKLKSLKSPRIGPTTMQAIEKLRRGASWREAGIISDTCGSAVRVAPIGLVYHFNFNLVENYAAMSSMVTHLGSAAIGGAVAVAVAIACKILDYSDEEMLSEVLKRVVDYDSLLTEKIKYAAEITGEDLDIAVSKLGNSISALDVVPMAFYCVFSGKNFEESIFLAANAGGDADSIAAICGAIKGIDFFPERFVSKLKDADHLREVARRLWWLHLSIARVI